MTELFKSFCSEKETTDKETAYWVGENICKWYDQKQVNIQNTETAYTTQY